MGINVRCPNCKHSFDSETNKDERIPNILGLVFCLMVMALGFIWVVKEVIL